MRLQYMKNRILSMCLLASPLLHGCQTLDFGSDLFSNDSPVEIAVIDNIPMQPQWTEYAPAHVADTNWVVSFSDPVLTNLVHEAISNNPDIGAARARYDAAAARADMTHAARRPSLNLSASGSRSEYGNDFISDANSFGAGFSGGWEIDLWGRLKDQADAGDLEMAGSRADLAGARLAITRRVAQGWYDLVEARLLSELTARDVQNQQKALRLTERRFEGGVARASDVRLARSSLAGAEAQFASRKQRQSALARTLEVLLRRYPSESLQPAADLPALPPLPGVGAPEDLLTRRPDIIAAERRLHASGLNVEAARKALYPSLSLSARLSDQSAKVPNLFDWQSLLATLAADLGQPLYDGGRLKANVRQQQALLRQQAESYAGVVLGAYMEVENALDAEQKLADREAALRTSLEEAQQAESRLERRYAEGLVTILELLDAQSRRFSAESQLITARKERLTNRIALHVALGGGLYGRET